MADIVTNTLQIGSNNLILQDAGARQNIATNTQDISDLKDGLTAVESDVTDLKEEFSNIGLSVVDGAINITYQEVSE